MRGAFQQVRNLLDLVRVPSNHQMCVLGQNGTCPDRVVAFGGLIREPLSDLKGLLSRELHRRVLEGLLSGLAQSQFIFAQLLEFSARKRLCGAPEAEKFPATNKIGPRSSRIIREPESISRQDDMIPVNHGQKRTWNTAT